MDRKQFLVGTASLTASVIGLSGCKSELEKKLEDDRIAREVVSRIQSINDFNKDYFTSFKTQHLPLNPGRLDEYSTWHTSISLAIAGRSRLDDYDIGSELIQPELRQSELSNMEKRIRQLKPDNSFTNSEQLTLELCEIAKNEASNVYHFIVDIKKTADETGHFYSLLRSYLEKDTGLPSSYLFQLAKEQCDEAKAQLSSAWLSYRYLSQDKKDALTEWVGKVYLDARSIQKEVTPFSVGKLVLENIGVHYKS